MNWLAEIMPLFFVRWYANRYCERICLNGDIYTDPRPGVLIRLPTTTTTTKED